MGAIEPSSQELLSRISSLSPTSMSWSNVCDYCTPRAFHNLARSCSGPKTVHVLHMMNWVKNVKGTTHIDYMLSNPQVSPKVIKPGSSLW